MPRSKEQNEILKERRKKMIANAALKIFCIHSFEGSQMIDIAREAHISHGLIYHYFKDKQDIFDFLAYENGKNISKNISEIYDKNINNRQKLKEITDFFIDFSVKNENFPFQFFTFISRRFQEINILGLNSNHHKRKEGGVFDKVYKIIDEGKKTGEFDFKYTSQQAVLLYWSIIQGSNLGYTLCPEEARKKFEPLYSDTVLSIFTKKTKGETQFE